MVVGSPMHPRLLSGTIVVTDLHKSREFYEQFLGLECVRYASNRMLLRDRRAAAAMQAGKDDCFVIDVEQVSTISHPQRLLHHWGFDVSSTAEVDRIHMAAAAVQERFGIRKITPVSQNHGARRLFMIQRYLPAPTIARVAPRPKPALLRPEPPLTVDPSAP